MSRGEGRLSLWYDTDSDAGNPQWVLSEQRGGSEYTLKVYEDYEDALAQAMELGQQRRMAVVELDDRGQEQELFPN